MTDKASARSWYALAVLFIAYTFAFVDRAILSLLVGPIRADLQISDTQISLLHGFAFALFYTVLGIPIARLADQYNRRNIIAAGVAAWSIACAACGLARNFTQLFLGRIGVGIGEAGLSPAAYSMLADQFPPRQLGLAIGIYTSGVYIGAGLAMIIGGAVIAMTLGMPEMHLPLVGVLKPWQATFFIVGLPGLLIALLMFTVREPARRRTSQDLSAGGQALAPRVAETFAYMRRHARAYGGHIFGFTLISVVYNAAVAWGPTFMIRRFELDATSAGYALGSVVLICGTGGVIAGGYLADTFSRRAGADGTLRVGVISALGSLPTGVAAFLAPSLAWFLPCFGLMLFIAAAAFGAAAAGLQSITPNRMRAQVSAVYLFVLNMVAVGFGPTAAALLTDYVFRDDLAVGQSVAVVIAVTAPLAALLLHQARRAFIACAAQTQT